MIDLSKCFHVDSKPENFLGHKESGIPILPFEGREDDMELPRLTNYLTKLYRADNAQAMNTDTFKLEALTQADGLKTAIKLLFNQK